MKRKIFFQQSGLYWFFISLLFIISSWFIVGVIYCSISVFMKNEKTLTNYIAIFGGVLGFLLVGFELIRMIRQVIILEEKSLYVPNEWGMSDEKVQYEVKLQYRDIVNMYLRETTNDSHNKPMKRYAYVTLPKTYLVLCDAKGKEFAVNIVFYTKNCRIKIVDSIIYRMELQGNNSCNKTGKEIYEDFLKKRNNRKV